MVWDYAPSDDICGSWETVAGHARTPGQDRRVAAKGCHAVRETHVGIPVCQARVVHCNESASHVGHTQTRITTREGTTPQIRTVCPFPIFRKDRAMLLKHEWHVLGIAGEKKGTTTVVGSESDCRTIAKKMVSTRIWSSAWLYPPGSSSDDIPPGSELDGVVLHEPFEVYIKRPYPGEWVFGTAGDCAQLRCDGNWLYHYCFDE